MINATYDYQSSHPGYIDMEFKELDIVDECKYPVDSWRTLRDLIKDGYYFECDIDFITPTMERVFDNMGNPKEVSVSVRYLNAWCRRVFRNHGDIKKVDDIYKALDIEMDKIGEDIHKEVCEDIFVW